MGIFAAICMCPALAAALCCHAGNATRLKFDALSQSATITCTEMPVEASLDFLGLDKPIEIYPPCAVIATPSDGTASILVDKNPKIELMPKNASDAEWQNAAMRNETLKLIANGSRPSMPVMDLESICYIPSDLEHSIIFFKKECKHVHICSTNIEETLKWIKWNCPQLRTATNKTAK